MYTVFISTRTATVDCARRGLVTKFLSKLTGVTARSAASRGNMEMKRVHEDEELFESLLDSFG